MTRFVNGLLPAMLLLSLTALPACAANEQQPATGGAAPAGQMQAQAPSSGMGGGMGHMMGQGGMGQGGMGHMMGQGGMGHMMGQGAMMGHGPRGRMGMGRRDHAMIDHIEGRIAFVRAEIKIAPPQEGAWNALADALRANAKRLGDQRAAMPRHGAGKPDDAAKPSLAERLERREQWLAARLDGLRAIKLAYANLQTTLTADQKQAADELLSHRLGVI